MKIPHRFNVSYVSAIFLLALAVAWIAFANPFIPLRSDVELVGVIMNGNHVLLSDSRKNVASWDLQKDRYQWVTLPSQLSYGAPSQLDSSFFAITRSSWSSKSNSSSEYLHYFDGTTVKELSEWPRDGRSGKIVAVGKSYLCDCRVFYVGSNVPKLGYGACEFYKTDGKSIQFDHQLLLDSRHSVSSVCSTSPTKVLIYQTPNNADFSQFVLYDVQDRRIMAIGKAEFGGQGQIALHSTSDGKYAIAYDGAKLSLVHTTSCSTRFTHNVENNVGLLNAAISDDHKFAVVASSRLSLFDLITEESIILDELNSSQIESKEPLLKAPNGDMAEIGARLTLCAAGVAFVPNSNRFVVWMHSGEVQYWDAEKRVKTKTTQIKFE